MVSAGILQSKFAADNTYLQHAFLFFGIGFILLGYLLAELLSRRLKGQKIAIELERVTSKYREHDAMLHAIKEGVITLTPQGKITLINDEALRLLNFQEGVLGKRVDEVIPESRLRDLLLGRIPQGDDELVLNENFSLRVNRRSVRQMGRDMGAVVTLRDRTEHIGLMRERGVNLSIDAEVPLNDISIEQNALITIVGNLLDNAIDAASGTKDAHVEIGITALEGGRKLIRVHDSGPGLPDPNPEVIFEDGYTTKPPRAGGHRGIGLAIVQRLVKQADGEITCFNQGGATFVVELPTTSNINELVIS
jgi:sensor histidine kinase regulating citrate/malate metabolism